SAEAAPLPFVPGPGFVIVSALAFRVQVRQPDVRAPDCGRTPSGDHPDEKTLRAGRGRREIAAYGEADLPENTGSRPNLGGRIVEGAVPAGLLASHGAVVAGPAGRWAESGWGPTWQDSWPGAGMAGGCPAGSGPNPKPAMTPSAAKAAAASRTSL